jgi:hypothetical protein
MMSAPLKGPSIAVAALALVAAAGCSGGDDTTAGNVCDEMGPYDSYSAGIVKVGEAGLLKVKLTDAVPAPPARGDNTWTVQILDAGDTPMSSGGITAVKPFMPHHGHGTNVTPEIGTMGADGSVEVQKIDFMMPGVWTVTVGAEAMSQSDEAVFAFCIDG